MTYWNILPLYSSTSWFLAPKLASSFLLLRLFFFKALVYVNYASNKKMIGQIRRKIFLNLHVGIKARILFLEGLILPCIPFLLLKRMKRQWKSLSVSLFATLYTVHEILQARILEWVAYPNPGIKPGSPALRVYFLPTELPGKSEYSQI